MRELELENCIYTESEYQAFDAAADRPNEFWSGQVFRRGARSGLHVSIAARILTALNVRFEETPFEAVGSLLRVGVPTSNYAYPDVVVWDADAQWTDNQHTLMNPRLLIEIVSPSTAALDWSVKLEAYKQIPSLLDTLLVSQNRVYIEHFRRTDEEGKWDNFSYYRRDQIIRFGALELEIPVAEIYRRVDVPEQLILFETLDD